MKYLYHKKIMLSRSLYQNCYKNQVVFVAKPMLVLVMDIKQHMIYVTKLLEEASLAKNWEAAIRFTYLLSILRQDLILEQEKIIADLRKAS
jgi:hypothetical protein